jgi:hypothetical protein
MLATSSLRSVAFVLLLMSLPQAAAADAKFAQPAVGTRTRRAILDAIRPKVERAYQQKVKFSVRALETDGTLALAFLEPMTVDNIFIGELKTTNSQGQPVHLDGWVFAIVEHKGDAWRVLELDILSETEGLDSWPSRYPAIPKVVFDGVGLATNAEG